MDRTGEACGSVVENFNFLYLHGKCKLLRMHVRMHVCIYVYLYKKPPQLPQYHKGGFDG